MYDMIHDVIYSQNLPLVTNYLSCMLLLVNSKVYQSNLELPKKDLILLLISIFLLLLFSADK